MALAEAKLVDRWRNAWGFPGFRSDLLWSSAIFIAVLLVFRFFLDYVEGYSGNVLTDRVLSALPAIDLRWLVWTVTYSGILLGLVSVCFQPTGLLLFVRSAIILIGFRVVCLLVFPLDPPVGYVPLVDPLVQLPFVQPLLTRDLFFSWHISALTLFVLVTPGRDTKIILTALAFIVALSLLFQHAQYSIGILAAPCFTYAAFGFARLLTLGGYSFGQRPQQSNGSTTLRQNTDSSMLASTTVVE